MIWMNLCCSTLRILSSPFLLSPLWLFSSALSFSPAQLGTCSNRFFKSTFNPPSLKRCNIFSKSSGKASGGHSQLISVSAPVAWGGEDTCSRSPRCTSRCSSRCSCGCRQRSFKANATSPPLSPSSIRGTSTSLAKAREYRNALKYSFRSLATMARPVSWFTARAALVVPQPVPGH